MFVTKNWGRMLRRIVAEHYEELVEEYHFSTKIQYVKGRFPASWQNRLRGFACRAARYVFVDYFTFFGGTLSSGKDCNCTHTKSGNPLGYWITAFLF